MQILNICPLRNRGPVDKCVFFFSSDIKRTRPSNPEKGRRAVIWKVTSLRRGVEGLNRMHSDLIEASRDPPALQKTSTSGGEKEKKEKKKKKKTGLMLASAIQAPSLSEDNKPYFNLRDAASEYIAFIAGTKAELSSTRYSCCSLELPRFTLPARMLSTLEGVGLGRHQAQSGEHREREEAEPPVRKNRDAPQRSFQALHSEETENEGI